MTLRFGQILTIIISISTINESKQYHTRSQTKSLPRKKKHLNHNKHVLFGLLDHPRVDPNMMHKVCIISANNARVIWSLLLWGKARVIAHECCARVVCKGCVWGVYDCGVWLWCVIVVCDWGVWLRCVIEVCDCSVRSRCDWGVWLWCEFAVWSWCAIVFCARVSFCTGASAPIASAKYLQMREDAKTRKRSRLQSDSCTTGLSFRKILHCKHLDKDLTVIIGRIQSHLTGQGWGLNDGGDGVGHLLEGGVHHHHLLLRASPSQAPTTGHHAP